MGLSNRRTEGSPSTKGELKLQGDRESERKAPEESTCVDRNWQKKRKDLNSVLRKYVAMMEDVTVVLC